MERRLGRLIDITNVSERSAHIQHVLYSRDSFAYLSGSAIRRNQSMKSLSRGLTPALSCALWKRSEIPGDSHDQRVGPLKTHHITKRASTQPKGRKGKKRDVWKRNTQKRAAVAEFRARALSFSRRLQYQYSKNILCRGKKVAHMCITCVVIHRHFTFAYCCVVSMKIYCS